MFTPGEKVGSFVVVARLWTRPSSITFLAKRESDESAAAYVAIECLDRAANDDAVQRDAFLERSRLLATVRAPSLPSVIEMGEQHGIVWVAREFKDGVSLPQLFVGLAKRRLRLSPGAGSAIVLRVARVLAAVEDAASLAHGGVETDRILIGFDGSITLVGWFTSGRATAKDDAQALGARLLECASSRRAGDTFFAVAGDAATQHLVDVARDAFEGRLADPKAFAAALAANAPLAEGIEDADLASLVAEVVDADIERTRVVLPADVARVVGALRPPKRDFNLEELTAPLPEDVSVEFAPPPHPRRASIPPKPVVPTKAPVRVGGAAPIGGRPAAPVASTSSARSVVASNNTAATRPGGVAVPGLPAGVQPVTDDEEDEVTRIAPLPKEPPSGIAAAPATKSPADMGLGKQPPVGLTAKPIPGSSTSAKASALGAGARPLIGSSTSAKAVALSKSVAATPAKADAPTTGVRPAATPGSAVAAPTAVATGVKPAATPGSAVAAPTAGAKPAATPASAVGSPAQGPGLGAKPAGGPPKRTLMMNAPVTKLAATPAAAPAPAAAAAPAAAPAVVASAPAVVASAPAVVASAPVAVSSDGSSKRISIPPPVPEEARRASTPPPPPGGEPPTRPSSIPPPVPPEAMRASSPGVVAAVPQVAPLATPAAAIAPAVVAAPQPTPSPVPAPIPAPIPPPIASPAQMFGAPGASPFEVGPAPAPDADVPLDPSAFAKPSPFGAAALAKTLPNPVASPLPSGPVPSPNTAPEAYAPTTVPEPAGEGGGRSRVGVALGIGALLVFMISGVAFAWWYTHRGPDVAAAPTAPATPVAAPPSTPATGTPPAPPTNVAVAVDAGAPPAVDAGHDAGFDAGHDAGFDAGHDAGFDAGQDAGVVAEAAPAPPPEDAPETTTRTRPRTTRTTAASMTTSSMTTTASMTTSSMTTTASMTSTSATTMRRAGFLTDF